MTDPTSGGMSASTGGQRQTPSDPAVLLNTESKPRGVTARLARSVLRALLRRVRGGAFRVVYWDGTQEQFGNGVPRFCVRIHDPGCLPAIFRSPELGIGEALVEGRIEVDDLDAFLEVGLSQEWGTGLRLPSLLGARLPAMTHAARGHPLAAARARARSLSPLSLAAARAKARAENTPLLRPRWERAAIRRQQKDIEHHYELGNDFFALWLDTSLAYTCAYFETPDASLEEAQAAKWRHIQRKLQLQPGQRLLDIGCGWGALLFAAAQQYDVHAHGVTLSRQQHDFVQERARELGLQERVSVEVVDYRELARRDGGYDRVATVGMFEHVGEGRHADYMEAVTRLLKPGGLLLLQTITRRKEVPSDAWLRRYVLPGIHVVSWPRVVGLLAEFGFELLDMEDLRVHYPPTIDDWSQRFEACLPEVRALGYDERFIRMWRLYLRGCAAAFRYRDYSLHQFLVSCGRSPSPSLTRAHVYVGVP